jgi:tyrosyl-tRNA synthetase
MRTPDADIDRFLRLLTLMPEDEIDSIMRTHVGKESERIAQHCLAREVVQMIHGDEEAESVERQHRALFEKNRPVSGISPDTSGSSIDIKQKQSTTPIVLPPPDITLSRSLLDGRPLSQILNAAGFVNSSSHGARLLKGGGVYIASLSPQHGGLKFKQINPENLGPIDLTNYMINNKLLILRIGKSKVRVIEFVHKADMATATHDVSGV